MGIVLVCGISCTKPEAPQQGPAFKAVNSNLAIPAKGGEAGIVYEATAPVSVSIDKSWCDVYLEEDQIRLVAPANLDLESRYALVVVTCDNKEYSFTVQQYGFRTSGFAPSDINAAASAYSYSFPYDFDDIIVASTDADWITLVAKEDELIVNLAENTTAATPDFPARTAEISWQLGIDFGTIKVSQKNVAFMQQDNNWKVSYDGRIVEDGEELDKISNTVAKPGISGKYGTYYVAKSEFTASGLSMDEFAQSVGEAFQAEIDYVIEFYGAFGYELSYDDFLHEDSDYDLYYAIDPGDYIAFAIGCSSEGKLTGRYQYQAFTIKNNGGGDNPGGDPGDITGTWVCSSVTDYFGDTYKNWTMTITKSGSSYSISGFDISFDEFLSQYDLATKAASATLSGNTITVANNTSTGISAGGIPVTWLGVDDNQNYTDIKFTYDSSKNTITLATAMYGAYVDDGDDSGWYSLYVAPVVFTRTSGGGGGDNPGDDSSDLAGKWICPSVEDYFGNTATNWTWNIKKSGSSYTIENFDAIFDDILSQYDLATEPAPATLSGNTLTVARNTETGIEAGGIPVNWVGLDDDMYLKDIEFKVDAANYTITLVTPMYGAYVDDGDDSGFYSLYTAPLVFYKEGHVSAPKAANRGTDSAAHQFVQKTDSNFTAIHAKSQWKKAKAADFTAERMSAPKSQFKRFVK